MTKLALARVKKREIAFIQHSKVHELHFSYFFPHEPPNNPVINVSVISPSLQMEKMGLRQVN